MSNRQKQPAAATVPGNGPRQHTLKAPVHCTGIGLHSGANVAMSLFPAPPDHGIVFRRTDIHDRDANVPALWHQVIETNHCTVLGNEAGTTVSTVEHLMATLAGLGVDNALVTLDGPEVPIMDGSAAPFVFLLECAGLAEQNAPRRAIRIRQPVLVVDNGRVAAASPSDSFSISVEIDFEATIVARQECFFRVADGTFKAEIARARTFGFMHEVDELRAAGLARGGSLENAVMVADDQILNEGGLRYDNEFVRHKVLDCIGDMYLAGSPILGHIHGVRSGHAFNNRLLRAIFADPENWELVEMPEATAEAADAEELILPAALAPRLQPVAAA
jgi:UDP-3-O-[3-hydroxymyristoyl] N-acetylglucosamine deacetylase